MRISDWSSDVCSSDLEYKKDEGGEWQPVLLRVETTVGRALLSEILPKGLPFSVLNRALQKKEISRLINQSFRRCGLRATVIFADKLMQPGFQIGRASCRERVCPYV